MATVTRIDPISVLGAGKKLRTCAYCRVSTNSTDQLHSYAAQVRYYTKAIQAKDEWEFVDIFADEGITGTRADKRTEFQRMIKMCYMKRIDLILTKSISRFARNVPECLEYARTLRRMGIGIIFEENGINTLRMGDELMMTTFSAIAQEESVATSQRLKHMNRERMKRGEYTVGTGPYGYRYENKKLVTCEGEAEVVRWIFDAYLSGWSLEEIAQDLERRRVPRRNPEHKWRAFTVQYILSNEKYIGDTLYQKTFKTDTVPFTQQKNCGELEQYYVSDSHEPIISRETYQAAALLLAQRAEYYGRERSSTPYPLTRKIRCSRCGAFFIRKVCKDTVVWSCRNHIKSKDLCDSKRYSETQIYGAFMRMFNKLYYNSKQILQGTLYQLEYVMNFRRRNDAKSVEINQQIITLTEKKHMLEQLRTKGYMPDALFHTQAKALDRELEALRRDKEIINDTLLENTYSELKKLTSIIEGHGQEMTTFEEDIFDAIVRETSITPDGEIQFTLLGDVSFTERL